jgi:hypothetical protein
MWIIGIFSVGFNCSAQNASIINSPPEQSRQSAIITTISTVAAVSPPV